jgi:hypothetical protein
LYVSATKTLSQRQRGLTYSFALAILATSNVASALIVENIIQSPCLIELQQEIVWSSPQKLFASWTVNWERTWRGIRRERGVVAARAGITKARRAKDFIVVVA